MTDRMDQLLKMLAADPADAFCLYGVAMEFSKRGDCAKAIEYFDRTLIADPNSSYAYFHKAKAQEAAGAMDEARRTLQTGKSVAERNGDAKAANEIAGFLEEIS